MPQALFGALVKRAPLSGFNGDPKLFGSTGSERRMYDVPSLDSLQWVRRRLRFRLSEWIFEPVDGFYGKVTTSCDHVSESFGKLHDFVRFLSEPWPYLWLCVTRPVRRSSAWLRSIPVIFWIIFFFRWDLNSWGRRLLLPTENSQNECGSMISVSLGDAYLKAKIRVDF